MLAAAAPGCGPPDCRDPVLSWVPAGEQRGERGG
jgi:hypothetical protein